MKKTIQALLAALVVLLFGSAAAGSPVATTPIIVVAPARSELKMDGSMKKEEDRGGGPIVAHTVMVSSVQDNELKGKTDQGDTETIAYTIVARSDGSESEFKAAAEDKGGTPPVRVTASQGGEVLHVGSEETDQGGAYAGKHVEGFTGPGQPKVEVTLGIDKPALILDADKKSAHHGGSDMTRGAAQVKSTMKAVEQYGGMYG